MRAESSLWVACDLPMLLYFRPCLSYRQCMSCRLTNPWVTKAPRRVTSACLESTDTRMHHHACLDPSASVWADKTRD